MRQHGLREFSVLFVSFVHELRKDRSRVRPSRLAAVCTTTVSNTRGAEANGLVHTVQSSPVQFGPAKPLPTSERPWDSMFVPPQPSSQKKLPRPPLCPPPSCVALDLNYPRVCTYVSCSVTLRVASLPSEGFDGEATVSFQANGAGSPAPAPALDAADSGSVPDGPTGDSGAGDGDGGETVVVQSLTSDGGGDGEEEEEEGQGGAAASFDVAFYHCIAGNFWNSKVDASSGASICAADGADTCCELCSEVVEGAKQVFCFFASLTCQNGFYLDAFIKCRRYLSI